ncbi:hypothetical protein TIFTF001_041690 [Ficus carica]|uniref:Uncharacterized protein n=1 Tax=Ficus carica TaxID=3494 RepID=A0AA87ZGC3_FICCA|nr:hypothetical protein TIFTF001_041690 [Ficus carica]
MPEMNERRILDANVHASSVQQRKRTSGRPDETANDLVTWPKKLPENLARDTSKYCEFHKDYGHNTVDCRALRAEVAELLKKGHLREFLTEKGRETYGLAGEHKERRVVQHIEDTPSPPPVRKQSESFLEARFIAGRQ